MAREVHVTRVPRAGADFIMIRQRRAQRLPDDHEGELTPSCRSSRVWRYRERGREPARARR